MESPSQCAAVIHPPPGIAEAPWKRLKSEPKRALEGNPEEEDEFNDPEHQILHYFDADIHLRETQKKKDEIEKKEGRIRRGRRCGGMGLVNLTCFDDIRAELIRFSKLALEKYNAKTLKNQGEEEMFVFHDLVKATHRPCGIYFITFRAKKAGRGDGDDEAILTFLAKVWQAVKCPPRVMSCFLKPTQQFAISH